MVELILLLAIGSAAWWFWIDRDTSPPDPGPTDTDFDAMDVSDDVLGDDLTGHEGNAELMDDELFDEGLS